jgi:histidyl-tRNA synthetase
MQDKKLDTAPYKGVRDFYPEDMRIQNYIFSVMRTVAESFGYEEYSASLLEPTELYAAKSGEELVSEQTYTFEDRGGRSVTLRPEMTPSLARMIAGKRRELSLPLRWYSIPNCFRYERPQRGRLREHWQLNCDLFGVPGVEADAEIITLAYNIMRNFGAKDEDFVMKIAHRGSLEDALNEHDIPKENKKEIMRLIDKKGKLPEDERQEKLRELGADFEITENADISDLLQLLKERGVQNVSFDPDIVRGFDYYTGMVFEVFDTNSANSRSLFGGGRYDHLLEVFGVPPLPAVGFGMGDVGVRDFLFTHEFLPQIQSCTQVYVCTLSGEFVSYAKMLADKMRNCGVNVAVNLTDRKVGDQIASADEKGIPYVIVIGEDEVSKKEYTVKNLLTGEESRGVMDEVLKIMAQGS